MAYGLQVVNGNNKVIIDDTLVSLVKIAGGTLSPQYQSGNSVTVYNGTGKGADPYTSTFPNTAEMWGTAAQTLYYYPITNLTVPDSMKGPLFVHMNVGDQITYGRPSRRNGDGSPRTNEIFTWTGIISTRSTLPWAVVDQRDINTMPTGFGMAVYSPDGKCRWSADDQLAWIPYFKNQHTSYISYTVNKNYGGWIFTTFPITFAFDGPGATTIYGRFVRTAAGVLDYIVDPYYATHYPGYPNPPTGYFSGWGGPVMLGSMG